MLPDKIQLEIVAPDRLVFRGEVDEVTVPGLGGALGILPGHASMLSELESGVLSYRQGGEQSQLYCGAGFVEVLPEAVAVLAQTALLPEEIDPEQVRAEQQEAEQTLRSRDPETDYQAAVAQLRKTTAQLEVAG